MIFSAGHSDYRLVGPVDMLAVCERLSEWGELTAEGPLGIRFDPSKGDWPATYFRPDGTIHLVTGSLRLEEVAAYLDELALVLGSRIVEAGPEH